MKYPYTTMPSRTKLGHFLEVAALALRQQPSGRTCERSHKDVTQYPDRPDSGLPDSRPHPLENNLPRFLCGFGIPGATQ